MDEIQLLKKMNEQSLKFAEVAQVALENHDRWITGLLLFQAAQALLLIWFFLSR